MTTPPLPESPCVRVRLDYQDLADLRSGSRFYLSYSGSAPTGANCIALADAVAAQWGTDLQGLVDSNFALREVDVLDIASDSGFSGQWTGNLNGSRSGGTLPVQCANNCEFNIQRRYRGGKPRMYLPPGTTSDLFDNATWNDTFVGDTTTSLGDFFTGLAALDIGAMGTLQHVSLSYYQSFKNMDNTSGRARAVPQYRTTAVVDKVVGYSGKAVISSQRRRRTATTY